MAKVTYGSGSVTVTLDGTLERTIRAAVQAASNGLADAIEQLIEGVANDARDGWYEQVDKRTGKSRESIDTELRITPTTITGVVLATQKATYMIRRPGPLSMLSPTYVIPADEYGKVYAYVIANKAFPPGYKGLIATDGHPYRVRKLRPNPKASDGKSMWQENVMRPGRKQIKASVRMLEKAAKKAVKGVSRG